MISLSLISSILQAYYKVNLISRIRPGNGMRRGHHIPWHASKVWQQGLSQDMDKALGHFPATTSVLCSSFTPILSKISCTRENLQYCKHACTTPDDTQDTLCDSELHKQLVGYQPAGSEVPGCWTTLQADLQKCVCLSRCGSFRTASAMRQ